MSIDKIWVDEILGIIPQEALMNYVSDNVSVDEILAYYDEGDVLDKIGRENTMEHFELCECEEKEEE